MTTARLKFFGTGQASVPAYLPHFTADDCCQAQGTPDVFLAWKLSGGDGLTGTGPNVSGSWDITVSNAGQITSVVCHCAGYKIKMTMTASSSAASWAATATLSTIKGGGQITCSQAGDGDPVQSDAIGPCYPTNVVVDVVVHIDAVPPDDPVGTVDVEITLDIVEVP